MLTGSDSEVGGCINENVCRDQCGYGSSTPPVPHVSHSGDCWKDNSSGDSLKMTHPWRVVYHLVISSLPKLAQFGPSTGMSEKGEEKKRNRCFQNCFLVSQSFHQILLACFLWKQQGPPLVLLKLGFYTDSDSPGNGTPVCFRLALETFPKWTRKAELLSNHTYALTSCRSSSLQVSCLQTSHPSVVAPWGWWAFLSLPSLRSRILCISI